MNRATENHDGLENIIPSTGGEMEFSRIEAPQNSERHSAGGKSAFLICMVNLVRDWDIPGR